MTAGLGIPVLVPCPERVGDGTCGVPVGPDGRHWTRATAVDPTLPHQIRIGYDRAFKHRLTVSCNCCLPVEGPKLGTFTQLDQAWALYRAHLEQDAS